jgi:tetratricopeptide (TPR) repeat protein
MGSRRLDGVFVSSVYEELKEYRKAAIDAVWRCSLYPIGMERDDIAKPGTTTESSKTMLDKSSVYVGIFSQRLGRVTVEELRYAQRHRLPILAFSSEQSLNKLDKENDPQRAEEMQALKNELRAKYTVASFRNRKELGSKVLRSLFALREERGLTAIPASPALGSSPQLLQLVPTPPAPYIVHEYFGGSAFVGRRTELRRLDAWVNSADPVLIVDAIGGSGKSALVWEWTHVHLSTACPQHRGLVWWSFYEPQATVGAFLAHTLAYLTERPVEVCAALPRASQEEQLLGLLRSQPLVLVLDGVERLLLAYHRQDASRIDDSLVDAQPRDSIDSQDGALLRALSRAGSSKVILISRLIPQDLQIRTGQLLQGICRLPLRGLNGNDAVSLLAKLGVQGNAAVMRSFLARFGDHALLVQILAGRILAFRSHPGNFDMWYQTQGSNIAFTSRDLAVRRTSILQAALEDLDPIVFRLLCRLAAFRYPVEYEALTAINPFRRNNKPEASLERLHAALSALEERGLVQWDRKHNRYDLHPVVRAYAYERLENKKTTYAQMRSYFERMPTVERDQIRDVADLRQVLELYFVMLHAGQADEAIQLYDERLRLSLRQTLGAFPMIVEVLAPLFPEGFGRPPTLKSVDAQASAAYDLAYAYHALGSLSQAQELYALEIKLHLQERDLRSLAAGLGNLGRVLRDMGRPAGAERCLKLGLTTAQASTDQGAIDLAFDMLVSLYGRIGALDLAENAYAALMMGPPSAIKNASFTLIHTARLRWEQGKDPMSLLEEALIRSHRLRFLYAEREAWQLMGIVCFAQGDLRQTDKAWTIAYRLARRQSVPLGNLLANLARLRVAQGDEERARELLYEALAIGGFGVELAAVEVFIALGEAQEAQRHVENAYLEAWADGPPYAFSRELAHIRAALRKLSMPEPQLPSFDPDLVASVPHEANIRAFIVEVGREPSEIAVADKSDKILVPNARRIRPSSNGHRT